VLFVYLSWMVVVHSKLRVRTPCMARMCWGWFIVARHLSVCLGVNSPLLRAIYALLSRDMVSLLPLAPHSVGCGSTDSIWADFCLPSALPAVHTG
jgi:hypothetical protein